MTTLTDVAMLICQNLPLPAGLTTAGDLYLSGYTHPLPAGLTTTGYLDLRGYTHPLPAGLTRKETRENFRK
jgi:hypothetical protein